MKNIKLKLNNKELGFHFGLGFLGGLLESLDCGIEELMEGVQKNPFKFIPQLMYNSYDYNCKREGKENEYNLFSFTDLIDDDGGVVSENVSKFLEAFTGSMTKDVPKEKPSRGGKRKAVQLQK